MRRPCPAGTRVDVAELARPNGELADAPEGGEVALRRRGSCRPAQLPARRWRRSRSSEPAGMRGRAESEPSMTKKSSRVASTTATDPAERSWSCRSSSSCVPVDERDVDLVVAMEVDVDLLSGFAPQVLKPGGCCCATASTSGCSGTSRRARDGNVRTPPHRRALGLQQARGTGDQQLQLERAPNVVRGVIEMVRVDRRVASKYAGVSLDVVV